MIFVITKNISHSQENRTKIYSMYGAISTFYFCLYIIKIKSQCHKCMLQGIKVILIDTTSVLACYDLCVCDLQEIFVKLKLMRFCYTVPLLITAASQYSLTSNKTINFNVKFDFDKHTLFSCTTDTNFFIPKPHFTFLLPELL